jgi:hypothetical protein
MAGQIRMLSMRTDEEVPQHHKKAKKKKFGLEYAYTFFGKNGNYTLWYQTERARDQALIDLPKHECHWLKVKSTARIYRKVER